MVEDHTRAQMQPLLDAVADEPARMPLDELVTARNAAPDFVIDRHGDEVVVWVDRTIQERFDELSKRQREVCTLVAGGMSNEQIATALFVSVATVKDHMHAILSKFGLRSRAQLIAAWYGGLELD